MGSMGQSGLKIHNFNERLEWSQAASEEQFWDAIYRKAFPNIAGHLLCKGNNEAQHQGIDRIILLTNGRILKVDEKKRSKVYADILLEYISVDSTGAPGWIEKDLVIDYLSYAFMPNRCVFLWDWCLLKRAWLLYGEKWKREYPAVLAQNEGYKTWSVPVPIHVLENAVSTVRFIYV